MLVENKEKESKMKLANEEKLASNMLHVIRCKL